MGETFVTTVQGIIPNVGKHTQNNKCNSNNNNNINFNITNNTDMNICIIVIIIITLFHHFLN